MSKHALFDTGKRDGSSALTQQQMAMYEPGALDLQVQHDTVQVYCNISLQYWSASYVLQPYFLSRPGSHTDTCFMLQAYASKFAGTSLEQEYRKLHQIHESKLKLQVVSLHHIMRADDENECL